jgi:hypothetical protein
MKFINDQVMGAAVYRISPADMPVGVGLEEVDLQEECKQW